MTDSPPPVHGVVPGLPDDHVEGTDPVAAFEARLLRGLSLKAPTAAGPRNGFHVRLDELLSSTGRRGAPRH